MGAFQVPVIEGTFVEEVGNKGGVLFWHKVGIGANVGVLTVVIRTFPFIGAEEHPSWVKTTLYAPETVVLNEATFPGLVTPEGTVQA